MYRGTETLVGPGIIELTVNFDLPTSDKLSILFSPEQGQIRIDVVDTGVSDWQRLRGAISPVRFTQLVAVVRAVLALPADDLGQYDCGTHGFWIEEAKVELPLASGLVLGTARCTKGFTSQELIDRVVFPLLAELSRQPGTVATSWSAMRRRRVALRWLAGATLAVALIALLAFSLARCG